MTSFNTNISALRSAREEAAANALFARRLRWKFSARCDDLANRDMLPSPWSRWVHPPGPSEPVQRIQAQHVASEKQAVACNNKGLAHFRSTNRWQRLPDPHLPGSVSFTGLGKPTRFPLRRVGGFRPRRSLG